MLRIVRLPLLVALAGLALVVTIDAAAAWGCTARSRFASGWGIASCRSCAAQIALNQCAIRTPRGYMCRISSCRR